MSNMERILRLMQEKNASDVYLSANAPAMIRINGQCVPINGQVLQFDTPRNLLAEVTTVEQMRELSATGELNVSVSMAGVGRFRVSAMRQRGSYSVVVRYINIEVPQLASLNVPAVLGDLVMEKRGLILMVGSTGAGKTTTQAAMIEHRNQRASGHILTIEDPIEFLFKNNRSVINQREIGSDTASLAIALKNALRQAPDVILIGEIRDRETMTAALAYAQTGHLCMATLHANNSYQALNRILNFYPVEVRATMLADLSSALKAIVSQRLLRTPKGARVPAVEVMLNSLLVADMISKGDIGGVKEAMEKSIAEGSQTFEADIARLITTGVIDRAEGLAHADSATNLMWRLQNDFTRGSTAPAAAPEVPDDEPSFTEFTLDVKT
ncbi:MAG: PilT/PilU family type 4a pilus ATPase [Burkholderiales bacterium]|nr:PilT/PilU family type 4a pilus ATPase [Burkholderiales bacterium]